MQARLALRRFRTRGILILATLFAGLAVGGSLGYTIKAVDVTPTSTHPSPVAPNPADDTCVHVVHHVGIGC